MRIARNWRDYTLLDATGGEKLERWGDLLLIRPDPQVIWKTPRRTELWEKAYGHYRRSSKGGGAWEFRGEPPRTRTLRYGALRFQVRPTNFKHMGLFPEQAVNWDWLAEKIRRADRPVRVLNLFAYTGGATLACACAGAEVCHVDAAKGMVQWARENARASALAEKPVRWIVDDCEKFLRREARRGQVYDAIIMDPPSYGRGPGGEVWKLESGLWPLVELCLPVLSPRPLFFLLNSYTAGLSPSVMGFVLSALLVPKFGGKVFADEIGLPVSCWDSALPCGASAVWEG